MITWPNWQWRVPETGRITASCTGVYTYTHTHTEAHTHTLGFTNQSLTRVIPLWVNKTLRGSPSLWEMLYIFLCHPRQKQVSDLERATQHWLLLEGVNISAGRTRATAEANTRISNVRTVARNNFRLLSNPCDLINSSYQWDHSKGRHAGEQKRLCTKFKYPTFLELP